MAEKMIVSGFIKSFDGIRLFCRKQGCGPAVLLVHGACVDSDCFEPLAVLLAEKYTVYRYDRAGCGRSDEREAGDSLLANAKDLREVLGQIGLPVRVIAHSAGGAAAMKLAEMQPEIMSDLLVFEPVIIQDLIRDANRRAKLQKVAKVIQEKKNFYQAFRYFEGFLDEDQRAGQGINQNSGQGSDQSSKQGANHCAGQGADQSPSESRADCLSPEKARHVLKNCRTFFMRDFTSFMEFHPDYKRMKELPIFSGYGSLGRGSFKMEAAALLAERTGCPIIEFPGGHNAPYENPAAFISVWEASAS